MMRLICFITLSVIRSEYTVSCSQALDVMAKPFGSFDHVWAIELELSGPAQVHLSPNEHWKGCWTLSWNYSQPVMAAASSFSMSSSIFLSPSSSSLALSSALVLPLPHTFFKPPQIHPLYKGATLQAPTHSSDLSAHSNRLQCWSFARLSETHQPVWITLGVDDGKLVRVLERVWVTPGTTIQHKVIRGWE